MWMGCAWREGRWKMVLRVNVDGGVIVKAGQYHCSIPLQGFLGSCKVKPHSDLPFPRLWRSETWTASGDVGVYGRKLELFAKQEHSSSHLPFFGCNLQPKIALWYFRCSVCGRGTIFENNWTAKSRRSTLTHQSYHSAALHQMATRLP